MVVFGMTFVIASDPTMKPGERMEQSHWQSRNIEGRGQASS